MPYIAACFAADGYIYGKETKPKMINVSNQKGGVGKSTTVYNLEPGLALDGKTCCWT